MQIVSPHGKHVPSSHVGKRGAATSASAASLSGDSSDSLETDPPPLLCAAGFALPPQAMIVAVNTNGRLLAGRACHLQLVVEALERVLDARAILVTECRNASTVKSIA